MKPIGRMISWLNTGVSSVASVLVLCLIVHVSLDVLMRYAFERPLDATILYVSAFYMVAIAFLPLGVVEENNGHIAVEVLAERLPTSLQSVLLFIATLVTTIVTAFVAVRTGQEALAKYAAGAFSIEAGGKIITWPTYFFLPAGFGLMSLVSAWKLLAMVTGKDSGLRMLAIEDPYLSEDRPND